MSELFQAQSYAARGPLDYNPDSAVAAGAVVVYGTTVGIVICDIPAGGPGALVIDGVFLVVKDSSVFAAGDAVYWNPTGNPVGGEAGSGCATSTPGANLMGSVPPEGAALTGDATVQVFLTSAERTATLAGSLGVDGITGTDSNLGISGLAATQGGQIVISGGASAGGNNNGGALTLRGGTKNGSGVNGVLTLGDSGTSAVAIGAASIPTTVGGPVTVTPGGSTAAAGSTTSDAGVLPAGTAGVYPTTAADDTKGVRVHASDKVSGRLIKIGNGVSNKILKVYAPSGGTINGGSADAAFSGASGKGVEIYCLDSTGNTWLAW